MRKKLLKIEYEIFERLEQLSKNNSEIIYCKNNAECFGDNYIFKYSNYTTTLVIIDNMILHIAFEDY